MNKNSQSQLVEDLMSIAKLGSSEVEGLKGTFYFDDLIKLIKDIIKKLEKMMDEELTDAEQHSIPKGEYKEGYLLGYSDAMETMLDEFENMTVPKHKLIDEIRRKLNEK